MTMRKTLLSMTALAGLLATPVLAQTTSAPRDGTPGNPPSTATQRAADAVTGDRTPADGTPGNPPGTAAGRAVDRAAGTNMSGAYPQNSDGTANNPAGTAVGRAADRATTPAPGAGTVATTPAPAAGAVTSTPAGAAGTERASRIIGSSVYNEGNESVGSVDDLLFGSNGPSSAVISVGGFLGIGAKLVQVPYSQLRWNGENNRWMISGATRESLTALPEFSYDTARRG